MKREIPTQCLNILLLFALLTGCGGARAIDPPLDPAPHINPSTELPARLEDWPSLQVRHPGVPAEYDLVAESDLLRLYIKEATTALVVEDKRSGRLWRSSPSDLAEVKVSQAWRNRIESPILLSYTDADRGRAQVAKSEEAEIDLVPVEGGVRATYRLPDEGFELQVFYAVRGDVLEVTIPEAGIVESSDENTLVSLDVLSFFGATHDGEGGYIVFPEGSGATMSYTSPHPEAVQEISVSVYGEDQFDFEPSDTYHQPAPLPIFGLVKEDQINSEAAFVAILTQGDFDARLAVARSGKTVPYNHVWATFVYRRRGEFSLTGGQPAWLYEPNLAGGTRQIRYCLLAEEHSNYVGIATRYRDFMIRERDAQRVKDAPLMHLLFYMGTERRTWFLRDLVQMTTFDQTGEIVADLRSAGVSEVDVTLAAWNRGAVSRRYPQRLPVEKRWGGEDGLRALSQELAAHGQRLFLADNYLVAMTAGKGVFPFADAIRGVDGLPVGEGGTFFLNPQVSLRKFAVQDIATIAGLGADGLWLEDFAAAAVPDTNDRYPLSREGFAATWMQIANLAREQMGAVAMTGGNGYAVPYTDVLAFVPLDSTHYDIFDETVPLYQIAIHGLVSYAGQPYNLLNDGQRTVLHQIEYGATPAFVLTKASSSLLYRTEANGLYSTQYDTWRDEVLSQYRTMERLASTANRFIVDHGCLAAGVCQTVYEDGIRVVVNYNDEPHQIGSVTVPQESFVVLCGEERCD
jgi:hypothetical protein